MKCNTRVVWRDARRKGSGKPYRKAIRWYHSGFPDATIPVEERAVMEVCDGAIVATINARDEPEWGGSYATLEIAYKCHTCGASAFPHLPSNSEQISKLVTAAIALM